MTRNSVETSNSYPLAALNLIEYLQCDDRPTFILDADLIHGKDPRNARFIFSNNALRSQEDLLNTIQTLLHNSDTRVITHSQALKFSSWLLGESAQSSILFEGLSWSSTCLHQRWIIVSGSYHPSSEHVNPSNNYVASSRDGTEPSTGSARVESVKSAQKPSATYIVSPPRPLESASLDRN